jgi:hypothetical protein
MGDPILLIFSPEFLKIFLSEKTLFRESLSQFKVVWGWQDGHTGSPQGRGD